MVARLTLLVCTMAQPKAHKGEGLQISKSTGLTESGRKGPLHFSMTKRTTRLQSLIAAHMAPLAMFVHPHQLALQHDALLVARLDRPRCEGALLTMLATDVRSH